MRLYVDGNELATGLRGRACELLAAHPDGATLGRILAELWPDTHPAARQFHTAIAQSHRLRSRLTTYPGTRHPGSEPVRQLRRGPRSRLLLYGGVRGSRIPSTTSTEVIRLAKAQFPDSYVEFGVSDGRTTLLIYRVPTEGFDTRLRQRFPDVPMAFVDTTMSLPRMQALSERIMVDFPYWKDRGIHINAVGPDPDRSAVRVETTAGAGHVRRLMQARYGDGRFYVVHAERRIYGLTGTQPTRPS